MGTTLTGTTPQDTYDSLIKVTDNGPLGATAKYLSDGLGNDSVLALSTSAVGVGATTLFTKMSIANSLSATSIGTNYNAGILNIQNTNTTNGNLSLIGFQDASASINLAALGAINTTHSSSPNSVVGELGFYTKAAGGGYVAERMRITSAGNVGIGTSSPTSLLTIQPANDAPNTLRIFRGKDSGFQNQGLIIDAQQGNTNIKSIATDAARYISFQLSGNGGSSYTQAARIDYDGLKFGSDTAAANALDDYEEGTWTIVITFGGASVGVTTLNNTGTYTKIGRKVTVNGRLSLTSKGSSSGNAEISGLPFTIGNTQSNYSAASFRLANISFANAVQAFGVIGGTSIALEEITEAGSDSALTNADFVNTSDIMLSFTYFV